MSPPCGGAVRRLRRGRPRRGSVLHFGTGCIRPEPEAARTRDMGRAASSARLATRMSPASSARTRRQRGQKGPGRPRRRVLGEVGFRRRQLEGASRGSGGEAEMRSPFSHCRISPMSADQSWCVGGRPASAVAGLEVAAHDDANGCHHQPAEQTGGVQRSLQQPAPAPGSVDVPRGPLVQVDERHDGVDRV